MTPAEAATAASALLDSLLGGEEEDFEEARKNSYFRKLFRARARPEASEAQFFFVLRDEVLYWVLVFRRTWLAGEDTTVSFGELHRQEEFLVGNPLLFVELHRAVARRFDHLREVEFAITKLRRNHAGGA